MAPLKPKPKPGGSGSPRGDVSNKLWALQSAESFANQLAPAAANYVNVVVVGLPQSNLQNLYLAAISIASGVLSFKQNGVQVEGFVWNSTHTFQSKIDYMQKAVVVRLGYEQGGWKQGFLLDGASQSAAAMIGRPIQDPVSFLNYPKFLQKAFGTQGPGADVPGTIGLAIGSVPSSTPGLPSSSNGSDNGSNNTATMSPAPLIKTCAVPPSQSGQPPTGVPSREQIQAVLLRLFGVNTTDF